MRRHFRASAVGMVLTLAVTTVLAGACASTGGTEELRTVAIEVVNDEGPSYRVRVTIDPVGHRKSYLLGWVPIGETRTFEYSALPGRYRLYAVGGQHGQTGVLTARNPRNTSVQSERFTIDGSVDRIAWTLSSNIVETGPARPPEPSPQPDTSNAK